LNKLKKMIEDNTEAIKAALFADFKKPAGEVELAEIGPSVAEADFALANLEQWMSDQSVVTPPIDIFAASKSYIKYEPKGLCLILSPWNYPFNLTFGPLASCLAAGNRAIIKPSEITSNASALIAKMVSETFDPTDVTVVEGSVTEATEL